MIERIKEPIRVLLPKIVLSQLEKVESGGPMGKGEKKTERPKWGKRTQLLYCQLSRILGTSVPSFNYNSSKASQRTVT